MGKIWGRLSKGDALASGSAVFGVRSPGHAMFPKWVHQREQLSWEFSTADIQPSKIGEYSAQDLWTSWSWQLGWHRDRYSRTPMAIWRIVPKNRWLLDCKMMLFLDFQKKHLDNSLRTPRVYMTYALYAMSIYVYRMVFDQFLCNRTAGELSNYANSQEGFGRFLTQPVLVELKVQSTPKQSNLCRSTQYLGILRQLFAAGFRTPLQHDIPAQHF